jgi:hypothetical protein
VISVLVRKDAGWRFERRNVAPSAFAHSHIGGQFAIGSVLGSLMAGATSPSPELFVIKAASVKLQKPKTEKYLVRTRLPDEHWTPSPISFEPPLC